MPTKKTKKREYGTGSIFVRKGSGKLVIKYRGKQYNTGLSDNPTNRKKAQILLEHQVAIDKGFVRYEAQTDITIEKALEMFISDKLSELSNRSRRNYQLAFKHVLLHRNLECNYQNIYQQCKSLRNNYKAITYNTYIRPINVFVEYCKKQGIIKTNEKLYSELRRKDITKREVVTFNQKQIDLLFNYWQKRDYEFYLLLKFLRFTGARITETLRLEWKDVKKDVIEFPNKINGDIQYFPITPGIREVLDLLRTNQNASDKVFRWMPSTYSRLRTWLNESLNELGININKGNAFHVMRKTFATELFEKNVELYDIRDLMRHSSIETTLNHYKQYRTKKLSEILHSVEPERN